MSVPKHLTKAEVRTLLRAATPEVRWFCTFMLETGLRAAEALSITREEASSWPKWRHHPIVITGKGAGSMHQGGGKERVVLLTPKALKAAHRLERVSGNGHLVPWSPRTMRRRLTELGERCGIHLHPHRFRHSLAQRLIEGGASLQEVADILGHSNLQTARIYSSSSVRMRKRALRRRR